MSFASAARPGPARVGSPDASPTKNEAFTGGERWFGIMRLGWSQRTPAGGEGAGRAPVQPLTVHTACQTSTLMISARKLSAPSNFWRPECQTFPNRQKYDDRDDPRKLHSLDPYRGLAPPAAVSLPQFVSIVSSNSPTISSKRRSALGLLRCSTGADSSIAFSGALTAPHPLRPQDGNRYARLERQLRRRPFPGLASDRLAGPHSTGRRNEDERGQAGQLPHRPRCGARER